jgi:hypothetical protein
MNLRSLLGVDVMDLLPVILGGGITCIVTLFSLVIAGFAIWRAMKMMKGQAGHTALKTQGLPAPATVVAVAQTGMMVNYNPQIRVQLQVHPPDGAPYEAVVTTVVPQVQAGSFLPGTLLHVRYDPNDRSKVAVVGSMGEVDVYAPAGGTAPELLPTLQRMLTFEKRSTDLRKAGLQMEGVIRAIREVGLYVAGKNPYMSIDIDVEHPHEGRYTATTEGVISQLSAAKYQPGARVLVVVDRIDRNLVEMLKSVD